MNKRLECITEKDKNFSLKNSTPQMPAFNSIFGDVLSKFFTQDHSSHDEKTHEDTTMEMAELP